MARDLSGSPERALWLAVITQAVEDAQGVSDSHHSLADDRRLTSDARNFLADRSGYWRRARTEACSNAGIDPEWLRENAASIRLPAHTLVEG